MDKLLIEFDRDGIEKIVKSNQKVCLIKGNNSNIIWASFSPFLSNQIEWNPNENGLYSSMNVVNEGVRITRICTTRAQKGTLYTYGEDESFSNPVPNINPGSYGVVNKNQQPRTFGLTQHVIINGEYSEKQINAHTDPFNFTTDFIPMHEKVNIFIGELQESVVFVPQTLPNPLVLDYTTKKSYHLRFNSKTNTFNIVDDDTPKL
eukprot:gene3201-4009_t